MLWKFVALAVAGYLLGTINGAIVVSRLTYRDDVRQHGSGNAGLTNFLRTYGGIATILVLVIDAAKTIVACLIAQSVFQGSAQLDFGKMWTGFFVVLGHMYPVFFHFKGGKGVLCCAALALMMDVQLFAILAVIFALCLAISRYVSLTSCISAAAFPFVFTIFFWKNWGVILLAFLLGAYVIFMHRENIKRLLAGTESRFSLHKKKNSEDIV